jgi:hypothetical protein
MLDSYNILIVKLFNNAEGASRYLRDIGENRETVLKEMAQSTYRLMIISEDNFGTLTERKELIPYYLFYLKHYLNQE